MADIYVSCDENGGIIPDSNPEKAYHYFIVNALLEDHIEKANEISHSGYDVLGKEQSGYSKDGDAKFNDPRKINAEDMEKIFGFPVDTAERLKPFEMKPCRVIFNRKGQISRIEFSPELLEEAKKYWEEFKKGGKK